MHRHPLVALLALAASTLAACTSDSVNPPDQSLSPATASNAEVGLERAEPASTYLASVIGADEDGRSVVQDVLAAFVHAGFPPIEILVEYHDDEGGCNGSDGLFRRDANGHESIHVCYWHESPANRATGWERIIAHEVAHAYLDHLVDDDARRAFLDNRGLANWKGGTWPDQGVEQAVEFLVWRINDGDYHLRVGLDPSCAQMRSGYYALMGEFVAFC